MKSSSDKRSCVEIFASNLKMEREKRGYSQEELGMRAGLDRTYVSHVERGTRAPTLRNLERLAIALEIDAYRLLMPLGK